MKLALLGLVVVVGCTRDRPSTPPDEDDPAEPTVDLGIAPAFDPPPHADAPPEPRIVPAANDDDAWGGDALVEVRRIVYRVTLHVPGVLGVPPSTVPRPTAELQVDVSEDRLRASFNGPGWPVEPGSQVRLRREYFGTYVFDSRGGRPLSPGHLAAWFQGHDGRLPSGQQPGLGIISLRGREGEGPPGDLICALLAEWSGQDRPAVIRRCAGGPPLLFRLGPWRAERTADVTVELPRHSLRADHREPPRAVDHSQHRSFLSPSVLARLPPERGADVEATEGAPAEGLHVENRSGGRVIVSVRGAALGVLDVGAEATFVGPPDGPHLVAGMRPLGTLAWRPQEVLFPGRIVIE